MNRMVSALILALALSTTAFSDVPQVFKRSSDENGWNLDERTLANKDDYLPSPASSNYQANAQMLQERIKLWREEDNVLWKNVNRHDENEVALARKESLARKSRRLAELRAEWLPGVYENRFYNILELPTKEAAARAVKRREMQDLSGWQKSVGRKIRDILSELRSLYKNCDMGQDGTLTEKECRELRLSAYERSMIENGDEWDQFCMDSGNLNIRGVYPPHVPLYPNDESHVEWDADAYVRRTEKYYEPASKDFAGAFAVYVEFSTNVDVFADAKAIDSLARNIVTNLGLRQRVWLIRQLCLAHGSRCLAPWRLLVSVGVIQAKEMQISGAQGNCSDEIAWLRNAVGSQYFKGQIYRLADDAFRSWLRSEMEKLLGRRITEADFRYVCKDEVLLMRNDLKVRKPYDGGDVLPHPFTLFGYTLGKAYDREKTLGVSISGKMVHAWAMYPRIDSYFGQENVIVQLAPISKIAYSMRFDWRDIKTKEDVLEMMKKIKIDVEKRLRIKLGEIFFESCHHVCDESAWRSASIASARSYSVFGPIKIEITAECYARASCIWFLVTDTEAEAIAEKERKENPIIYDREEEMRRRRELIQRRKARDQKGQPLQP